MTGKWRIGSYAGVGSSSISTVTNVRLFVDANGDGILDQNEIDNSVDYDGNFDPSIEAKITISLGAASIEYVKSNSLPLKYSTKDVEIVALKYPLLR